MSFFLSRLHRHLSGISERSLEQRLLLRITCRRAFFNFCSFVGEEPSFSIFCFCEAYSYTYEHAAFKHLQQAQDSATSPARSRNTTTCQPERDNASRQTDLARASMSSRIYTARCILKTNEEIELCPTYNSCLAWSSWHIFASRLFASNMVDLSVRLLRSWFFCL